MVDADSPRSRPPRNGGGGDVTSVRTANLARVLTLLRQGPESRARLAQLAGLSKSATSSIVDDLLARGLVTQGRVQRDGQVGRPGLDIEVNGDSVAGLGVEIAAEQITAVALDLAGTTRLERMHALGPFPAGSESHPPAEVLDDLARLIAEMVRGLRREGLRVPSIVVAAPGVILPGSGALRFSSSLGWTDVDILSDLRARLPSTGPRLQLENDARLSSVAEYEPYAARGVRDLICLTGNVGVGCGIIADGAPIAGFAGFAGEVGHLPLGPSTRSCRCGRHGCWENEVGLHAFLDRAVAADDPAHAHGTPLVERLDDLATRLDAGDGRVGAALNDVGEHLAAGVALLVDILNPQVVVLGGYFARFADRLLPQVSEHLARVDIRGEVGRPIVAAARLGFRSPAVGGAVHALDEVFADPAGIAPLADTDTRRADRSR